MITGGNWILENVLFYEWRWKYWDCLNFRVPPLNICTVGDWWEVQICLTWNFADNVDTSQYRYKNQLPFSARSCHTNDKFCLSPAFSHLWYGNSDSIITRWLWKFLVFRRVTHLPALFVIVGFYPFLNSARHLVHESDIGQQWPLVTFVAPVSSVQPGAWKWEDQHLPSKLTRSHLSLPTSQGSEPNVSFSVCYLLFPDIRHHLAT